MLLTKDLHSKVIHHCQLEISKSERIKSKGLIGIRNTSVSVKNEHGLYFFKYSHEEETTPRLRGIVDLGVGVVRGRRENS